MRVNEKVPSNYRLRKHNLGLEYKGKRITWAWIIELGLRNAEVLVSKEKNNGPNLHHQTETE